MRSIPIAMTWELLRRGRYAFLLAVVGANLMPGILLIALRADGVEDMTDPALIALQIMLIQCIGFAYGAALISSQEISPRVFSLPIATPTLVFWRMFPGMSLMFLATLINTLAMNAIFQLNWPLLAPALFSAASLALIQAALWYSNKSYLQVWIAAVAATAIGLWYKSRHGDLFSHPTHMWTVLTPAEIVIMSVCTVAAFFVAVIGTARTRCGEPLISRDVWGWLRRLWNDSQDRPTVNHPVFRSPHDAQFWYEWTTKGWLLPCMVAIGLVVVGTGWLIFNRSPVDLIEGLVGGGGMLSFVGAMGGLIAGNCGKSDSSCDMSQFLGTRPMMNRELSRTLLKMMGLSVVIAWAVWAVAFGVSVLLLSAAGLAPQPLWRFQAFWWYFPSTLLGCWIAASVVASIFLTGRTELIAKILIAGLGLLIGLFLLSRFLSRESQAWLASSGMVMTGIACAAITARLMMAARRRQLISSVEFLLAGSIWILLSSIGVIECLRHSQGHVSFAILLVGLAALSVLPIAAAPLAIGCNRTR